jgi:threonine synthase
VEVGLCSKRSGGHHRRRGDLLLTVKCSLCGRTFDAKEPLWRCLCGGILEPEKPRAFERQLIEHAEPGFWRYSAMLPPLAPGERVRLGEVMTPLVETQLLGFRVFLKLDYLSPSGSYKDRGAAVLVSLLRKQHVKELFDDSSGNAGAATAAYSAAAGIDCTVLVPARNSSAKLAQIRAYGAHLVPVEGSRAAVAQAAIERAATSFYASHVWHPMYSVGIATLGIEIWEQLGYRAPAAVVVPAGQGSLVLGLARAFAALSEAGEVEKGPAIWAVQSRLFPALASSFERIDEGADASTAPRETIAEGIACSEPLRRQSVVDAIRNSGGRAVAVSESEIGNALAALVRSGFYVEPTSAAAAAGLRHLHRNASAGPIVVVLTGSGLKAGGAIAEIINRLEPS